MNREQRAVRPADERLGGGASTPSFGLPAGAAAGLPERPAETRIGPRTFRWGERTYVMGIVNVTPDSFSGDGLLASGRSGGPGSGAPGSGAPGSGVVERAVALALAMAADGADLVDVGGESSRPGHDPVAAAEEARRVVPVVAAIREALPDLPISIDTTKPEVAEAALDAGADLVNDVWGIVADDRMLRLAAERAVPVVLMHNRGEARYTSFLAELVGELQRAVDRAVAAGIARDAIVLDPGFGFGKTPDHNLALLRRLDVLEVLGQPILLGTSRKSTLGRVLDLGPDEREEATLATTVLAVAAGVDVVRVHDVRANIRAARMAHAVVRGTWSEAVEAAPRDERGGPP